MAINLDLLGPERGEDESFAIEALVFATQVALQRAMSQKGVSYKELSERLGMTPARVSQIFSTSGPNLTLKTIARIAHAIGEDFEFVSRAEIKKAPLPEEKAKGFKCVVLRGAAGLSPSSWRERAANSTDSGKNQVAA